MGATVKVTTQKDTWKNIVMDASDKMLIILGQQMLNDSLSYIPKQEGSLRDSGTINKVNDEVSLVWDTPYAQAQWFGISNGGTIKNYSTPGTTKMWVEAARAKHGDDWEQVAQNAFDEGLT